MDLKRKMESLRDYDCRVVHGVLVVKLMLKEKLHQLVDAIKQTKSKYEYVKRKKKPTMPMAKRTYGSKRDIPANKKTTGNGLIAKKHN